MWISEVFHSIQGEGRLSGTPSTFIRTSGCNLRCWFCDTPETSWQPQGTERTVESLLGEVENFGCQHVVLTGGEPLLSPEAATLAQALRDQSCHLTIETAGTVVRDLPADLLSISPKLSNSTPRRTAWEQRHEARRHRPEVMRQLLAGWDYQLKFVVDAPEDLGEIDEYLAAFPMVDPEKVYLMPQGVTLQHVTEKLDWIQTAADSRGFRVSRRLHIELFGHTRGT